MSESTAVRLERLIASPPDLLFSLFADPEQVALWWAPDGYRAVVYKFDVEKNGAWCVGLRGAGTGDEIRASGVFRIVEPPRRLAFTWAWEDAHGARGHETEVDVRFESVPGGTRLLLTHASFESQEARNSHDAGWQASLTRIAHITENPK